MFTLPPLYDHQKLTDKRFLKYSTGLGKTYGSLNLIKETKKNCDYLIIVCPLVVKGTWEKVLKEAKPEIPCVIIHPQALFKRAKRNPNVKKPKILLSDRFKEIVDKATVNTCIIIDEAHINFRTPKGIASKVLRLFTKEIKDNVILLTATPIGNSIDSVFLIESLAHSYYHDKQDKPLTTLFDFRNYFLNSYTVDLKSRSFTKYTTLKDEEFFFSQFNEKWQSVTYETAKISMPDKNFSQPLYCQLSNKENIIYKSILEGVLIDLENNKIPVISKLEQVDKAMQYLSGFTYNTDNSTKEVIIHNNVKLKVLLDFIKTYCINEKQKFIIYDKFKASRLRTFETLNKLYPNTAIHCESSNGADELVKEFEKNDEKLIFISSAKATGVGINLQFCNNTIFFNQIPKVDREQAEGRSYRIGSKKDCNYYDIVVENTLDELAYQNTLNKQAFTLKVEDLLKNLKK